MLPQRGQKGFTLIELLIVIAIIGILAAVLIPNLLNARARAYDSGAQTCANSVQTAQEIYWIDNDTYTTDEGLLEDLAAVCEDVEIDITAGDADGWTGTFEHPAGTGRVFTATESSLD